MVWVFICGIVCVYSKHALVCVCICVIHGEQKDISEDLLPTDYRSLDETIDLNQKYSLIQYL